MTLRCNERHILGVITRTTTPGPIGLAFGIGPKEQRVNSMPCAEPRRIAPYLVRTHRHRGICHFPQKETIYV